MTKEQLYKQMTINQARIADIYSSYSLMALLKDNKTCSHLMMEAHELVDANFSLVKQIADRTRKEHNG